MAQPGSFNLQVRGFSRKWLKQQQASIEEMTDEIVAEAKQIAPVDTGRYRSSIRKEQSFTLVGAIGGIFGFGTGPWTFFVVSDEEYAEALELGHSSQAPHGVFGVAAATVRSRRGLG